MVSVRTSYPESDTASMQFEDRARVFARIYADVCSIKGIVGADVIWPRIILQTASADLIRYRERSRVLAERGQAKSIGAPQHFIGKVPPMAFLPSHVRGAANERDILRKAIAGRLQGVGAKKPTSTQQIYARAVEMEAALEMINRLERETGAVS